MRILMAALVSLLLPLSQALFMPMTAAAVEEPPHTVLEKEGKLELRAYRPMILASVEVAGSRKDAPNAGFGPLAGYIFGENVAADKIEMTAPVVQSRSPASASRKIEMTAPVTQTAAPSSDRWIISFVMPAEWTMATLPRPVDPSVTLTEQPARTMATIRFSGLAGERTQAEKEAELRSWIASRNWRVTGEAVAAYYDPPWTLPPFRRNEIMIPVDMAASVPGESSSVAP